MPPRKSGCDRWGHAQARQVENSKLHDSEQHYSRDSTLLDTLDSLVTDEWLTSVLSHPLVSRSKVVESDPTWLQRLTTLRSAQNRAPAERGKV
jgi:hypothetical protein